MPLPSLTLLSVKQRLVLLGVTTTVSLAILIAVNHLAASREEALEQAMNSQELDSSSTTATHDDLHKYAEMFGQVVALQKGIGLNPKDGLYGALRDAVHNVEKKLETLNDSNLLVDMLQLQRH